MNWEAIGVICAIIGVGYSIYQFHYLPNKEMEEAKFNSLAQNLISQKLLDHLLNNLKSYVNTNNCPNSFFGQGVIFGGHITYLEKMRETELSQEVCDKLAKEKYPKDVVNTLVNNLAKQITSFNTSQAYFDTTFKYSNVV
ncbi:MAG: hypothetical protein J0I84_22060 [Terrimonas sp.]|nr:hypothetical protein [Terrimonas sp.]OJY99609.1 MAG: hypothetical protein BGP13_22680 [Sphingobacteriales bacterium 40-81]